MKTIKTSYPGWCRFYSGNEGAEGRKRLRRAISGFRWSFYETSDVSVKVSLTMTLGVFCDLPGGGEMDL